MTSYAHQIREYWERFLPNRLQSLTQGGESPEAFFTRLGDEMQGEVSSVAAELTPVLLAETPEARENYLYRVALLQTARQIAEEIAMAHQLAWMEDPSLTLSEARAEWELDRPMDENLSDLALQAQLADYPLYSTSEMAELAKEWAVPLEFLTQMFEADSPYRFMMEHQDVMEEAASIRFLREIN